MKLIKGKSLNNFGIILSFGFIFFCFLISIFSYFIIPDNSRFSNQMHLEINSKHPGFSAQFIIIPNENSNKQNFISRMFVGNMYPNDEILISSYNFNDNGYSDLEKFPSNQKKFQLCTF